MTPYRRSQEAFKRFAHAVQYPLTRTMFFFERQKILNGTSWNWQQVYDRAHAAQKLDWEVVLHANDDGLSIIYRQKPSFKEVP